MMNSSLMMTTAVLILICTATPALPIGYSWDTEKGSDGSWYQDHWSPSDEGSPRHLDDGAMIDADPSIVSNVTHPYTSTIVNWIQISANQVSPLTNPDGDPDRLSIYGHLNLVTSTTDDLPLLRNDGYLYLDGSLSYQRAANEYDYYCNILGSGVLHLGSNGSLQGAFINGPDHVIEGQGLVGFGTSEPVILNRGVIRPKQGMLRVSGKIVNTPGFGGPAVLRGDAELDSRLHFDGATLTGGSIEAAAGPVTMELGTFSHLTIANGTLRVIGTINAAKMGRGVTIAAGAELRLQGDSGTISTPMLWVRDEQFADPITIQNDGTISLDGLYTNGSADMKVSVPSGQTPNNLTLAGAGTLLLGLTECSSGDCYSNNSLSADFGAGYIQLANHSIQGYGTIYAPLINQGRVTAAKGGTLTLQGDVTNANLNDPDWENSPFGTLAATPGARLQMTGGAIILLGQLEPEGGTIVFRDALVEQTSWGPGAYEVVAGGGVLKLGGVTTLDAAAELTVMDGYGGTSKFEIYSGTTSELINNGEITIEKSTELRQMGNDPVLLSGNGTIRLGGTGGYGIVKGAPVSGGLNQGFINGPDHTIRGAASFSTNLVNQGEVIAENGYLIFSNPFELSGPGNMRVINDGYLQWSANLGAHDFTMDATGTLGQGSNTPTLVLSGNFSFSQTDEDQWVGGGSSVTHSLTMTTQDNSLQSVEIGGHDYGEVNTGFNGYGSPNFDLWTFTVSGASTRVQLVDVIDNGNRTSTGEALYARNVSVQPGATLDLNCLALYTLQSGVVHKVLDGDGALFGGGEIIDTCGSVDLTDVIKGLQLLTGSNPAGLNIADDVNNDDRIGLEEVLYYLEEVSN